jgi:hypothetical protein
MSDLATWWLVVFFARWVIIWWGRRINRQRRDLTSE